MAPPEASGPGAASSFLAGRPARGGVGGVEGGGAGPAGRACARRRAAAGMAGRGAAALWGGALAVWLALCAGEGKDPRLPPGEEYRGVKGKLEWLGSSGLPTECGPRKLTKRSSPSDVLWLRDLNSREANCRIVSVTTARPRITPSRVSTTDPRKATTQRIKAASPKEGPRLWYFMPYYPHRRQHTFYDVLFPINRGASGYNSFWYYKSLGEDSSEEERRRKRDTLSTHQKRNTASLEG